MSRSSLTRHQPLLEIVQAYLEFDVSEDDVKFFSHLPVFFSLHATHETWNLYEPTFMDRRVFSHMYPDRFMLGLSKVKQPSGH